MKIRLMPLGLAIQVARARREFYGMITEVPWRLMLHDVPAKWFDEDCFLDVMDIDYYGHFCVLDTENGEEYSIPAWMVRDVVKTTEVI